MRILSLLFLIAVAVVGVVFFRENDQMLTLTFFGWAVSAPVAAVVGVAYGLGMLTGWSLLGLLRRSFEGATDFSRREPAQIR
jgi:uncharacterized membrane protein YciS (DUF1049 family)